MTKEKLDQVSAGIDRLGEQVINLTKENNALKFKATTLKQELTTLKEMLVQAHNDARTSKRKNMSSFGVSMFLLNTIIQTNVCLNKLNVKIN
jgi:regulator of replication initiation timing